MDYLEHRKRTPESVNYRDSDGENPCSDCVMFRPGKDGQPNLCTLVQAPPGKVGIDPEATCDRFAAK